MRELDWVRAGVLAAALAAGGVAACSESKGPAERAGERLDNTTEESTDGVRDLTDGPSENTGERLDNAVDGVGDGLEGAGDTIERRTDGDTRTN